jgi:hypothetical protein
MSAGLPLGLILEGIVAVLLAATLVYCIILERKLRALRSGQDGLKALIEGLNAATQRAQFSVAELRRTGEEIDDRLRGKLSAGKALGDELELMIEAGNNLANRLEGGRTGRMPGTAASAGTSPVTPFPGGGDRQEARGRNADHISRDVESRLLQALKQAR